MPTLPPSERRVAEQILRDLNGIPQVTSEELARRAEVSLTTVTRLCRSLELENYQQLRVALANEAGLNRGRGWEAAQGTDIRPDDSLSDVLTGLLASEVRALEDTATSLDLDTVATVADAIVRARRVEIYGVSGSGSVARDLGRRFQLIGLPAVAQADSHDALASAALLGPDDVAIAISHSGHTRDVVEILTLAGKNAAVTVAISNFPRSPVALAAKHALTTAARDTTFRSGALAGRQAQMFVADLLYLAVAQRTYDATTAAIAATSAAVRRRRASTQKRKD
ncbi:MurR/RpiR family transcriptional regulator [Fodinicola acaciae]|uniref:MurR/RpiR family transcriptional regulator n=1 Tax=Fodinicola acaciae TaxID=2681555 RepID=UPI0013D190A2|nr:MurR/RpiR family transcriptional regulator [Fodinicola acaciae]